MTAKKFDPEYFLIYNTDDCEFIADHGGPQFFTSKLEAFEYIAEQLNDGYITEEDVNDFEILPVGSAVSFKVQSSDYKVVAG